MNRSAANRTGKARPAKKRKPSANAPGSTRPLGQQVRRSLEKYFSELNGQPPCELYDLVLSEIEQPMLEVVMDQTRGNISKAAQYLGLNRATLRKKLDKYGLN